MGIEPVGLDFGVVNGGEAMRPDKPGYWWYKTSDGREKIAYIASGFSFELCVIEHQRPVCVSVFECSSEFGEWLGPAHPPKEVDRYRVFSEEITGRNYWGDHYSNGHRVSYRKDNTGTLVRYDDVKEYLLKDDDNG